MTGTIFQTSALAVPISREAQIIAPKVIKITLKVTEAEPGQAQSQVKVKVTIEKGEERSGSGEEEERKVSKSLLQN